MKKQICTCSHFIEFRTCDHFESVRKWLGRSFDRFLAISSLHKSIRRSDVEGAFAWARVLLQNQSEQSLIAYIQKICFEECRNIPLYLKMRKKELSFSQALEWITVSRKKWELDYLVKPSHFDLWISGFRKSISRPPPLPIEMRQLIKSAQDPTDAYCLFFDLRRDEQLQEVYWACLEDVASQRKNERLLIYLKHASNTSYSRMIGAELLIDLYDSQAKDRHVSNRTGKVFVPHTRPFHFDMHHSRGRSILVENFARAWETKCFQFDELDLRYSGSLFGVLFRERCYGLRGSMKKPNGHDWDWSDIAIDETSYQAAMLLEDYYYHDTVKKIRRRHPNLKLGGFDLVSI